MAAGSKRQPSPGVKSLYFPTVPSRRTAPVSVLDLEQYRLDHTVSAPTLRCTSDTDVSLSTMSISLPVTLAGHGTSVRLDDQTLMPGLGGQVVSRGGWWSLGGSNS